MSRIDWPALMRLGLVELRLAPEHFWGLTPFELTTICGGRGGAEAPLGRAALEALMRRHPDHPKE